jgi:hypothetical protein
MATENVLGGPHWRKVSRSVTSSTVTSLTTRFSSPTADYTITRDLEVHRHSHAILFLTSTSPSFRITSLSSNNGP